MILSAARWLVYLLKSVELTKINNDKARRHATHVVGIYHGESLVRRTSAVLRLRQLYYRKRVAQTTDYHVIYDKTMSKFRNNNVQDVQHVNEKNQQYCTQLFINLEDRSKFFFQCEEKVCQLSQIIFATLASRLNCASCSCACKRSVYL